MKAKVAAAAVICLVCAAIVPLLNGKGRDSDDVAATITRMENEGTKADLAHDTSWLKKNAADDFIAGTSFGDWETKDSMLKDAEDTANNKTNSASLSEMKVKVYGDTAIARYVDTYDDIHHGEHRSRKVICTDTWVKQGGAWKEAASHCSQAK